MKTRKFSLINLGVAAMALSPVLYVVSCNNNDNPISEQTQNVYDKIFEYDESTKTYKNKFLEALKNVKLTENKSREEVLKIAQEKLKNITNDELKSIIFNSFAKNTIKSEHIESANNITLSRLTVSSYIDIKDVILDKQTNEISFKYSSFATSEEKIENVKVVGKMYEEFQFSKLKLKTDVLSSLDGIFYPIISFESEQPNASIKCIDYWFKIEGINDQYWEKIGKLKSLDENELNKEKKSYNEFIELYNKVSEGVKKIDKLGFVDGKFVIEIENFTVVSNLLDKTPFYSPGYNYSEQNGNVTSIALRIQSPFFFSKSSEDGSITWEAYKNSASTAPNNPAENR